MKTTYVIRLVAGLSRFGLQARGPADKGFGRTVREKLILISLRHEIDHPGIFTTALGLMTSKNTSYAASEH